MRAFGFGKDYLEVGGEERMYSAEFKTMIHALSGCEVKEERPMNLGHRVLSNLTAILEEMGPVGCELRPRRCVQDLIECHHRHDAIGYHGLV